MNEQIKQLRIYNKDSIQYEFYQKQHKYQTMESVEEKIKKYSQFNKAVLNIKEALCMLNDFIDPSDPDLDLPNIIHAYQTAERIRKDYPDDYQFQITGIIHDVGKILYKFGEKSYFIVGDTYVLGCKIPNTVVCYDNFDNDPGNYNNTYYRECGIKNLTLAFGHDEYLYMVLKHNEKNHLFEDRYMNMIRYHSFYPWHTDGEYADFMTDDDNKLLKDVQLLNKYDLYSKEDTDFVLTDDIINYYDKLLDKYFINYLEF